MTPARIQLHRTPRFCCTCRMESVDSASLYPPERIVNRNCPEHGIDPDDARDEEADHAHDR